jgi:PAS domain S-box
MATSELSVSRARTQLYDVINSASSFEEVANKLLKLGERYLDADNAYVNLINKEVGYCEIAASTFKPDAAFSTGTAPEYDETYCRQTMESAEPVALHDAPAQGWESDPAYDAHGLDTYLGTRLTEEDEPYGTVCFVGEEARDEAFSEDEILFVELISQVLARELDRENHQAELQRHNNLVNIINRVLRHNIRNDMSVIRGRATLMADQLQNDPHGPIVLDKIDELIELSEKARGLEEVVGNERKRSQIDVVALVDHVADGIEAKFPNATVAREGDSTAIAAVSPTFERAIKELLENAAKHSGETPSICVTVSADQDAIEVEIDDNGPGLSEQEQEVLSSGVETPLIHGSGLGLWLAHWVVSSHGGQIESRVAETGTTMQVRVPRSAPESQSKDLLDVQRARDQYQAAFEGAFDAVYILNDEARIVKANPSAADLYGLDLSELRGRSIMEFLPERYDSDAVQSFLQENDTDPGTVTIVTAAGVEREIEISSAANIVPGQHLITARDVTERVEQQQALEETTQRLQAIVETCPDPILALDDEGVIQLWNEAAEDLFGYRSDEAVGNSILSLDIREDGQESQFVECFQQALAGDQFRNLEVERQTKAGETVHLSISTAPLRDETGSITGVMALSRDITDQKRREAELERYETVLQTTNDSAWVFDGTKRLTFVNDTFLNQVPQSRQEVIGTPLSEFTDLFTDRKTFEEWDKLVEDVVSGSTTEGEMDVDVTLANGPAVLNLRVTQLPNSPGAVVVARDISERTRREQELESLKQRYETLIEAAPNPVFVADYETGEILKTNAKAEALLDKPKEEIVGQHQGTLHPADKRELYAEFFEAEASADEPLRQLPDGSPIHVVSSTGEQIPVEIKAGGVELDSGRVTMGIFRELSAEEISTDS